MRKCSIKNANAKCSQRASHRNLGQKRLESEDLKVPTTHLNSGALERQRQVALTTTLQGWAVGGPRRPRPWLGGAPEAGASCGPGHSGVLQSTPNGGVTGRQPRERGIDDASRPRDRPRDTPGDASTPWPPTAASGGGGGGRVALVGPAHLRTNSCSYGVPSFLGPWGRCRGAGERAAGAGGPPGDVRVATYLAGRRNNSEQMRQFLWTPSHDEYTERAKRLPSFGSSLSHRKGTLFDSARLGTHAQILRTRTNSML